MSADSEIIALRARVAGLEARIDFLYHHLNIEFVEDTLQRDAKVIEMIKQGSIIEAIKIYRELYNVGLAEAKKAVDGLQARMGL
jgi:ribosomal protein L7/L12